MTTTPMTWRQLTVGHVGRRVRVAADNDWLEGVVGVDLVRNKLILCAPVPCAVHPDTAVQLIEAQL